MKEKKLTRREFVRNSGLAALGLMIVPRHVLGGRGYIAPSETINRAVIGTGGMGRNHLTYPGARTVAICDVDKKHLELGMEVCQNNGITGVKAYHDFREILDRPDIDVVHIASPPHWHGPMAVAAAEAGKDIWCEKPMTRTIAEGQRVIEAVQRNARIFRINTWFRMGGEWYDSGATAEKLKKVVASGLLGSPVRLCLSDVTGFIWKLDQWSGRTDLVPEQVPPELDYNFWLGPAPFKPYHPHRVHMSFRGYWDYDGGGLGDQGQHYTDPAQYILGKDDTFPVYIESEGPPQHPDAVGLWYRIVYRYANGDEILLEGQNPRPDAPLLEGPKGKVWPKMRSTIPDLEKKLAAMPAFDPMETEFYDCVRNRKKFALNEETSHRSCSLLNLGKIAIRLRRPLRFDPVKQVFVNDEEANRLIEEPMRAPWHV